MTLLADLYNLCCVSANGSKKFCSRFDFKGKSKMTCSASPSSFYQAELQRALREQAFGIKSSALISSSSDQANATLVLLDGSRVVVQLTVQGYSIVSNGTAGRVYETIEDLLDSNSPLYAKKRQEVLFSKLSKLS